MCDPKLQVGMCSSKLGCAGVNPFQLKLVMWVRAAKNRIVQLFMRGSQKSVATHSEMFLKNTYAKLDFVISVGSLLHCNYFT